MTTPTTGDGSLSSTDEQLPAAPGSSPYAGSSGFRGFTARHPIAALLILVFSIAYPLMSLVVLAQHQIIPGKEFLAGLPLDTDELSSLILTFVALLPSGIYVTWATEGRAGVRNHFRRVFRWRFGLGWWIFILTALPVLTLLSGILLGDPVASVDPVHFVLNQAPLFLIQVLLINLWEETTWAGVMQTRLERRHNVFVAALITAVPFGFAHWPLAFLGDITALMVPVSVLAYIVLGALLRPLAGIVMRGARDSVLAFALVHSVFNRTNNKGGIVDTLLDGRGYEVGFLVVLVVLTVAAAVYMRGKLGPSYRRALEHRSDEPDLQQTS